MTSSGSAIFTLWIPCTDTEDKRLYIMKKVCVITGGGSGMGLALCARIAALHGTTLQFASVPSQGTTISFCLQKAGSQPEVEP